MSYFEPVGLVASDIPQVGGGSTTTVKFSGSTAPKKDEGPGFWASLAKGWVAATPIIAKTAASGAAPSAAPAGMSTATKLLIGGGVAIGALILVLTLKK